MLNDASIASYHIVIDDPSFTFLMGGVFEFEFGGVKKKKVQYLLYAAYRTGLHTAKSCQGCITHTYMTYKQRYRRTISYVLSEISVLGGREKGTRGWKGNMGGGSGFDAWGREGSTDGCLMPLIAFASLCIRGIVVLLSIVCVCV